MNHPPLIKPVEAIARPRWSVMIPVYNCSSLLPQTLESVLDQDPGPEFMQIEVVDDASTDADVKALVERWGRGRVGYFRQPRNLGSLRNFETCINRSQGHIVHLLHGDDLVRQGYYKAMEDLFTQYPQIGAAFCHYDFIGFNGEVLWEHQPEIEEEGLLGEWLPRIASRQMLQYCTTAVKREVYEKLGGFYGVSYGEDWEMWTRIAAHYPMAYTPKLLAAYRMHPNSISSQSFKTARNIQDIRWVIGAIQELVPAKQKETVRRNASRHYAHYAISVANSLWHQTGSRRITQHQIRQALLLHTDPLMLWKVARIYIKMLINRV